MAKAVEAPIFHVNGEDVAAACWAIALALEYRNKFGRDAVLDLYCYRKYGHNEGDDPVLPSQLFTLNLKTRNLLRESLGQNLYLRE